MMKSDTADWKEHENRLPDRTARVTIRPARPEDAQAVANVRSAAFYADFLRFGECPGYGQTTDKVAESLRTHEHHVLELDGRLIGEISITSIDEETAYIGCLCVVPDQAGRGYGTVALRHVFALHPEKRVWTLVTPVEKTENLRFYGRMGFAVMEEFMEGRVRLGRLEMRFQETEPCNDQRKADL